MENETAVHSGWLLLPPNSKLILKKTWQQKFCLLYKASKFGIERLEIYDNLDEVTKSRNNPSKIITLENCVKVSKKSQTLFTVVTKSGIHEFSTPTEKASNEWIIALQSVAFSDDSSRVTTLVEDNDLYCSIGEGVFNVRLYETDASVRCNLIPKNYILLLTATAIQLREVSDDSLLYTWPYHFIRRYGYSNGKFTFEAGRKCDSGEGKFLLEHSNEQEIFRYITMKMKSMKKLLKSDSVSSLDCGDKQFQAMLNMEARSRSPLPPSPTTSTSLQDLQENFSVQVISEKLKISKNPAPKKPPRKCIPAQKEKDDYEFISKYDEVEVRNDAWRTLGTTEVNHSENIEDLFEDNFSKKSTSSDLNSTANASKIITEPESDYDYDKLNFFGSTSKINMGYKQIRQTNNIPPTPPAFNEYDEVHILEYIRPADDSHLGYAVVRKKEAQVDHKSINDTEYAVISKPKRV